MVFDSVEALEQFVLEKCRNAVSESEQEVHKTMKSRVDEFYGEYEPIEYNRTGNFRKSLQRTGVIPVGKGFEAEVYFDEVGYPSMAVGKSGMLHSKDKSDAEILANNLTGAASHGWAVSGTMPWTDSLFWLGDIDALLLRELKEQGIPI